MSRRTHKPDNQEVINRDVNAAERASMAVRLRAQFLTYDAIAKQCGYANPGACRKAIMRELDRTIVKDIEELRTQELSMLNMLHGEAWKMAMDKDNTWRTYAMDRVISISESRRKLMGMDVRPDEHLTQQNYTKTIVLTHETSTGGDDAADS